MFILLNIDEPEISGDIKISILSGPSTILYSNNWLDLIYLYVDIIKSAMKRIVQCRKVI